MSGQLNPDPQTVVQIQADLRQLAVSLREAEHLETGTQKSLAGLIDELSAELNSTGVTSAKTTRLAEAVSEVARSLHEQHSAGLLGTARDRLKEAAARAEIESPVATGVVYRLIEVLASMGI